MEDKTAVWQKFILCISYIELRHDYFTFGAIIEDCGKSGNKEFL